MRWTAAVTLTLLALLGETFLPTHLEAYRAHGGPLPMDTVARVRPAPGPVSTLSVAVANIREGSVVRHRFDMSDGKDRSAVARRMLGAVKRVPDVVLLQEALGSAGKVARTLTQHPRARRSNVRYAVAMAPRIVTRRTACAGPRPGRYTALRDSAILVNTRSVRKISARGVVRTWGRWTTEAAGRVGRGGLGCSEHPWVRVTVQQPGKQARTAMVMAAHVAPVGTRLKTAAIRRLTLRMQQLQRRSPGDLAVLGGDLNQARCAGPATRPETAGCAVRAGHRSLARAGFQDAVRTRNLAGPHGVVGVQRRIDFVYTTGAVRSSGFDRCYLAYFVKAHRCGARRAVFANETAFYGCQARSLYGTRAGSCADARQRRYYSDHPVIRATLG